MDSCVEPKFGANGRWKVDGMSSGTDNKKNRLQRDLPELHFAPLGRAFQQFPELFRPLTHAC